LNAETQLKTLVLGLGNPILSDDGVGLRIAREIGERCPDVDVLEASAAGFRVADQIVGYDRLLIVDAIRSSETAPGSLFRYTPEDFQNTLNFSSPHDMSFFEALELLKEYRETLPSEIIIYAVEVQDTETFSENCSPEVEAAIPGIIEKIINNEMLPTGIYNV